MSQSTEKYREDAPFSLFSFSGCISRQTYWAVFIANIVYLFILAFTFGMLFSGLEKELFSLEMLLLIAFPFLILFGWIGLATSVKRYRDANFSTWLVLLNVISYLGTEVEIGSQIAISFPFINTISYLCTLTVIVLNGFSPSVYEGNKYCKSRNNLSTKAIRWIYIIFLSPILLFLISVVI